MDRSPKSRKRSSGHQDRDIAAQGLLNAAKKNRQETDSDTGDSEHEQSDKENEVTLTDNMMGLKNSRSGSKKCRQSAADKAMEKATSDRASMLALMETRNSLFKSFVDRQAPVKEINLAPGNSEFGLCIELADMQQV